MRSAAFCILAKVPGGRASRSGPGAAPEGSSASRDGRRSATAGGSSPCSGPGAEGRRAVSYTHLRAHETSAHL
eukprot:11208155-Alexandrium_andersonii.AAC.1